ncbi:MAG: FixH family protein [Bacteroidales bacterium]|nr:FixH family protein [Bacteroidales bacterium]
MKMNWNWGTKLILWIVLFMGFIFVLVYLSTQNSIILVEKDYYPKGLEFQNRIDERNNALQLRAGFQIRQIRENVVVEFPCIKPDSGTLVFYRHNNKLLDQTINIKIDETKKMYFPLAGFEKGKYLVKFHWFENGKGYFVEKDFFFNE